MPWIEKWPEEYRPLLRDVAETLKFNSIHLDAEISGLSGARTFRAKVDTGAGIGNPVVVKIGTRGQIDDEKSKLGDAATHFNMTADVRNEQIESGNLACIVMSVALEGRGRSLRSCFSDLSAYQVGFVIDQLFQSAVQIGNRNIDQSGISVFAAYQLQEDGFVRELRAAGDGPFTLYDWWIRAVEVCRDRPERSLMSLIHGDLHGGNVLVDAQRVGTSHAICLLDFGLTCMGHAYRDIAKLERDIWLFVDEVQDETVEIRCNEIDAALKPDAVPPTSEPILRAVSGIKTLRLIAEQSIGRNPPNSDLTKEEYLAALMAQFMFAARNSTLRIERRRAALARAHAIRSELERRYSHLRPSDDERRFREMEDRAWRVAYSFLRLDQLPSGAWARSLPLWMEAIWEGEPGTVLRSPDMKINGGVDSTGYAVSVLTRFWSLVFPTSQPHAHTPKELTDMLTDNTVVKRCMKNLESRTGGEGGIDVAVPGRGITKVKLRHSLVGVLTMLKCMKSDPRFAEEEAVLDNLKYIKDNLDNWQDDESHLFGMYASGVALWSRLEHLDKDVESWMDREHLADVHELRTELNSVLKSMAQTLGQEAAYQPMPQGTHPNTTGAVAGGDLMVEFFRPYYDWWRMERSNALMFLPLLISQDGKTFLRGGELRGPIKARLGYTLNQLLNEIKESNDPETGLIYYYNHPSLALRPRDWGLSAELLSLLELPAIEHLILQAGGNEDNLNHSKQILRCALLNTLADYPKHQKVFKFTHGLSCGGFLGSGIASRICPEHVVKLDKKIVSAMDQKSTEKALYRLSIEITRTAPSLARVADYEDQEDYEAKGLTELFVSKLVAGEHSTTGWDEELHRNTIDFFDYCADVYNRRYNFDKIHATLVTRIEDVSGTFDDGPKHALDLGCGAGQCARWLYEHGFSVDLVDASWKMLEFAEAAMADATPKHDSCEFNTYEQDVRHLSSEIKERKYDLVVANALMVHIDPEQVSKLLGNIYSVLKPAGRFYVSFKLRDHTLISLDDRYFAYYRDSSIPEALLRNAGFHIDEIAVRWNNKTLYGIPKVIHWANFYCRRSNNTH